jgi:surfeit locus 1 family protein
LQQKEAMLAEYAHASKSPRVTDYKNDLLVDGPGYYSRVRLECTAELNDSMIAGRNGKGQSGWAHQFDCRFPGRTIGGDATVVIGWSEAPVPVQWKGGTVLGTQSPPRPTDAIAGCPKCYRHRVIADPPLAGLQPNARPDPRNIPNNHLAYAVQWFLFAGVALVIYGLALRKRWQASL